ncbi:MAG: hypothetical protein ACKVQJ_04305 [Pyrinomonadaceae bacterium]
MRILLGVVFLASCLAVPSNISFADNDDDCSCIASAAVQKYCEQEKSSVVKSEYRINQEAIARRDIQRLIDQSLEADLAKDETARSSIESDDWTIKELDGKIYTKKEASNIGASANNYQGILRISDDTNINVECLTLKGKEAIVYTNQHYVRYVPDRKDESPHELITNIIHRETWIFTEQGWKMRYLEELERGKTYLDGKLYNP